MIRERRLLILAIVCALAAAVLTFRAGSPGQSTAGPLVDVVVADAPLAGGEAITEAELGTLRVVSMPRRWAPPDALGDPVDALAARPQVDLPAGIALSRSLLIAEGGQPRWRLRSGERALSVEAVVSPDGEQLAAGSLVDLYASGFGGSQLTSQLISGAEVLAAGEEEGEGRAKQRFTLRLAAGQVAHVIRADVFAHELRAIKRGRE